jgi:hypothetical protein
MDTPPEPCSIATKGLGGILHCLTGEWQRARAALDMGFYISFTGNQACLKQGTSALPPSRCRSEYFRTYGSLYPFAGSGLRGKDLLGRGLLLHPQL